MKITFPDSTWWEILDEMPYGVDRKMKRIMGRLGDQPISADTVDEVNTMVLLDCTPKWSFGEVAEECLNQLPRWKVNHVLSTMFQLYEARDLEMEEELKKVPSNI